MLRSWFYPKVYLPTSKSRLRSPQEFWTSNITECSRQISKTRRKRVQRGKEGQDDLYADLQIHWSDFVVVQMVDLPPSEKEDLPSLTTLEMLGADSQLRSATGSWGRGRKSRWSQVQWGGQETVGSGGASFPARPVHPSARHGGGFRW